MLRSTHPACLSPETQISVDAADLCAPCCRSYLYEGNATGSATNIADPVARAVRLRV